MTPLAQTVRTPLDTAAVLHRVLWRIHFWAGLVVSPLVVFAALTGLLYVFTPQIEAWRHGQLDHVTVTSQRAPLDQQVQAVQQALPNQAVKAVAYPVEAGETTRVFLRAPVIDTDHSAHTQHAMPRRTGMEGGGDHEDHGLPTGTIAYVNPYSGEVVGAHHELDRFSTWAKKLHSSALQGNGWRWLIELAASWMLVLMASGLYLWWPRARSKGGPGVTALVPSTGQGRRSWRDWHAVAAIAVSVLTVTILVTGLTWSRSTGANFRWLQDSTGQATPKAPKGLRSSRTAEGAPLGYQDIVERWVPQLPHVSLLITPPRGREGVWRIENFDRGQPEKRFSLVVDAYKGTALFYSGWEQMPALSKATALGIPFHRGEFGVWNQVLLVLVALASLFSVVSGVVMWWKRRPKGQVGSPALPPRLVRGVPWWLPIIGLVLAVAMPVFGWSLLLFVWIEGLRMVLLRWGQKPSVPA